MAIEAGSSPLKHWDWERRVGEGEGKNNGSRGKIKKEEVSSTKAEEEERMGNVQQKIRLDSII